MTQLKPKSFRCEDGVWRQFKLICTINGDILQDKLGELVEQYVDSQKTILPKSVFQAKWMLIGGFFVILAVNNSQVLASLVTLMGAK